MNDDLSNKIMERIETDKTVPVPRWHFFILRFFFWLFAALSVIVGSFAFGVIFFLITEAILLEILKDEQEHANDIETILEVKK